MVSVLVAIGSLQSARAQEAQVATTLGKEIFEALGKDAAQFGGETVARQTAKRLVTEAAESAGAAGGRIAQTQVQRILATGQESLIFDLKSLSGRSLPLLKDVADGALPTAVSTLARPGVTQAIESLGSTTLQKAALAGELRLPGVGIKLVQHYGEEGAQLVVKVTEDQANSVIAAFRPQAIKALPSAERSALMKALTSRPDARVFNFQGTTGPLMVVAGGVVLWHAADLALTPDERVTEQPDGTVVREKRSVGSRAAEAFPAAIHELSHPLKWTGIALACGATLISGLLLWRRQRGQLGSRNT
jgi:hypothetical protein